MVLYNEFDPFAAEWLENLIAAGELPPGKVDRRSIKDLKGSDCAETTHFFSGIAGWPLALRLAGWPDERSVWTGSCPCQPYSAAGKRKGDADERNLWPEMFRLIRECRPDTIFGEQVESAIGHGWLDGISADLEGEGYAVGSIVLGAHSAGAPHIRQRLFWVAVADQQRHDGREDSARPREPEQHHETEAGPGNLRLADPASPRCDGQIKRAKGEARHEARLLVSGASGDNGGLGDASGPRPQERKVHTGQGERALDGSAWEASKTDAWSDYRIIHCKDGKSRRVGRSVFPLAYGIPVSLGQFIARLRAMGLGAADVKRARRNRTGRLKGYGNAIVPQVAAVFARAVMEWMDQ